MAGLLNSYRLAAAAAGLAYVGGKVFDQSSQGAGSVTLSLSGVLTGGIASSPQAGDFCIVSYSQAGTADRSNRSISNAVGAFTQLMTQYVNATNDTSITIAYKFLESPIDYNLIIGTPSSSSNGVSVIVEVFRGVNVTTPLDVAHVVASSTTTGRPDPASITPVTAGAQIVVFGAASFGASINSPFTSSDFDSFVSTGFSAAQRSHSSGRGLKAWSSGAFNAAQFGGGNAGATDTAIAVALALRPA